MTEKILYEILQLPVVRISYPRGLFLIIIEKDSVYKENT